MAIGSRFGAAASQPVGLEVGDLRLVDRYTTIPDSTATGKRRLVATVSRSY
jgi:hypothetical protein